MSGLRRTTKNATMLFSGTLLRMLASFAFIVFAANYLGVEGFGKYALVVHYYELFVSLTATGAGILLTRDIARWQHRRDQLFTSAASLVSLFGLFSPIVLMGLAVVFGYAQDTTLALLLVCLGLVPGALGVIYEAVFVALERAEYVTLGAATESLLRVGVSTAVLLLGGGILELAVVMVLTRVILVVLYYVLLRSMVTHRWDFQWSLTRRFAVRWRVFAAENWLATIYTSLDVIVLSAMVGETAVGLYSAAWRYVRLGSVLAKSFTTAMFPMMTRAYFDSQSTFRQIAQQTFRAMCLVALPIIVGVSIIPDRVVDLIYRKEYAASAPILQVLIWVLLLEFLNPFLSHILFSQNKQRYSMVVAGIGLVSNSLLMLVCIYWLGNVGAAYACVASGAIATGCYLYFTRELGLFTVLLTETLRVVAASAAMGAAIYSVSGQSWVIIGLVSITTYLTMLFVVQAVRVSDLRMIRQHLFGRAFAS